MSGTGPVDEFQALSSGTKKKLERLLQSDQESKLYYRRQGKEERQRKHGRVRRTALPLGRAHRARGFYLRGDRELLGLMLWLAPKVVDASFESLLPGVEVH